MPDDQPFTTGEALTWSMNMGSPDQTMWAAVEDLRTGDGTLATSVANFMARMPYLAVIGHQCIQYSQILVGGALDQAMHGQLDQLIEELEEGEEFIGEEEAREIYHPDWMQALLNVLPTATSLEQAWLLTELDEFIAPQDRSEAERELGRQIDAARPAQLPNLVLPEGASVPELQAVTMAAMTATVKFEEEFDRLMESRAC